MRVLLFILVMLSFSLSMPFKSFKYCGHIEVLGFTGDGPMMMPPMMMAIRGYVSPTGIDPQPPKSCVWVFLNRESISAYVPTIVVWSDTYMGYHADIYSDPEYIFGHRQNQPSDYSPHGIMERNKEMENYLNNAAGERVLAEILKAIREGKKETRFEDVIDVPIATTPGLIPKIRVMYYLYDIETDPVVPPQIRRLMEKARSKRIPHTPDWKPITVPKHLLGG
jgi:hypothetical protein